MTEHRAATPTWRILAELAAFFAVTALLGTLPHAPAALAELRPHPYGIAVLVASLAYGTRGGALATLAAAGAQLIAGWPVGPPGEDHFAALARQWSDPCLWLALTLLVGDLRDRQLAEQAELTQSLTTARSDRDTLAEHAHALRERIAVLEDLCRRHECGSAVDPLPGDESGPAADETKP